MASPLKRQRDAQLKQLQKQQAPTQVVTATGDQPPSLHLLLNEMDNDLKRLKALTRQDDKIALKRDELIPKYRASVEEYLESEDLFKNPLFSHMVVWMFDIEELETAIAWCDIAIDKGFESPFKRDFATFCADQVLAWSEKMSAAGHDIEPYFTNVFEKIVLEWRLNEKVVAKYYKFAGLFLLRDKNGKPLASSVGDIEILEKAMSFLQEAGKNNPKVGVTTHIDKIGQRIRAIQDGTNI
ncbi:phage terminase small subunit [Psychromonas sp. SR45-3]|uniref:phage terminase small subunit n=1 Tax=Psychromonas sp. SR45-3 TaxID=2760930 RepID=UPI0015F9CA60|nr:phage terminase small subunit [Psychromonas sp. SR45-3]MBB1272536.1 terminase [Psychromonas sp. SR45-3]